MRPQAFFEFLISLALLFWITLTHASNYLISKHWDDLNSTADDYAVILSGFPVDNKEMTYLRIKEYVEGILNSSEFDTRFKKEAIKRGLRDDPYDVHAAEGNPKGIVEDGVIMLTDCKDVLDQYRRKTELEALEKAIKLFLASRFVVSPESKNQTNSSGESEKEWNERKVKAKQVRVLAEERCCLSVYCRC